MKLFSFLTDQILFFFPQIDSHFPVVALNILLNRAFKTCQFKTCKYISLCIKNVPLYLTAFIWWKNIKYRTRFLKSFSMTKFNDFIFPFQNFFIEFWLNVTRAKLQTLTPPPLTLKFSMLNKFKKTSFNLLMPFYRIQGWCI